MLKMLVGPNSDKKSSKQKPTVLKGRAKHRISVEDRVNLRETARKLTTDTRNCLTCKLFTSCTKKAKGFDFLCDKYKERKSSMDLEIFNEPDKTNKSGKVIKRLDSKRYSDPESVEFDIEKTITNIVDNGVGLPPDFRVDDSDFPEAENFFHFATHEDYLNYKPRAKQLEVALNLFTDYCVAEGTLLFTDKGLQRIEDVVPDKIGLHPVSFKTVAHSGVAAVKFGGVTSRRAKCLSVTTHNGNEIVLTPKHKVMVLSKNYALDWKRASELQLGDVLVLPHGKNLWASKPAKIASFTVVRTKNKTVAAHVAEYSMKAVEIRITPPKRMTPELARLLGYLVADGSNNGYTLTFTNENKALLLDYEACLRSVFPDVAIKTQKYAHSKAVSLVVNSRIACDYIRHLGVSGGYAEKTVPALILQSDFEAIRNFVRALIDCDGFVQHAKVGLYMVNDEVVKTVALLMQNAGIQGRLSKTEYSTYKNPLTGDTVHLDSPRVGWWWVAQGAQSATYAELFGSLHSKKSAMCRLNARLKNSRARSAGTYNQGYLPTKVIDKAIVNSTITGGLSKAIRADLLASAIKNGNEKVRESVVEASSIGAVFSEIVGIEDAGYHTVYDITVPGPANFCANGVVVHNCYSSKCTNVAYMRCIPPEATYDEILDNCTLLRHGVCPKCKRTRFDMWREFNVPMYNELTGVAGQRGGKSALVAMLGGYTIHRFLKLPNPTQVFNQLPNSFFHGTFTATTFTQAQEAIFDPLFEIIDNSPWFKAYHELLDERGKKLGRELYKFKDTFFQYDHRNMLVYPAAPDKKNLRGRTRFLGGIDELGWFFAKSKGAIKLDPDEVYDSMRNSFLTLRSETYLLYEAGHYNIPPPIFCNVSSPSSARDKIMRLTHEAKSEPTMYSFHYSTMEMNPRIHPKVLEPYKKNMSSYRRDILAVPPDSSSPFINNRKSIIGCMDKSMKNMVLLHQHEMVSPSGVPMMSAKFNIVNAGRNSNPGRLMTIDAGQRFNSFAATIMHLEEIDDKLIPCLDAAFEIIPTEKNAVSFHAVYNSVLKPLIEEMNVKMVAADRWNSIKMLEDLENECDIKQTTYSVKYSDMLETRQAIINGSMILPKGEIKIADAFRLSGNDYPHCMKGYPMAHLYMQMLSVEDVMGKSVEKGQGYTDDLWRAFALGHALIVDEEVQEILMAEESTIVQTRSLGVVGSYSDSAGSSGSTGGVENRFGVVGSMGGGAGGSMTFSRGGR